MTTGEVGTISPEECWVLLEDESFGRLAYRLVDEVHIVPLDYVTSGRSIYLRTQAGNKLLAAALSSDVALEIDWRGEHGAWSVVVRGRLRLLEAAEHPLEVPAARPWVTDAASEVVELVPEVVEGRRFSWS
ncbi:pyridoxamine 5'-phosphate oxidase family protein [Nocardioides sp. W7]|uniref:pyridoxamine 5'-phosphate oxidase family protein n=1 Tax=Nocardioides sp. W7 TaxID=2931390 RepID=UPI001FD04FB1|nr:pyridoxamine 5'-phosphate oxidase family protein [Nocardioides sp. W7]